MRRGVSGLLGALIIAVILSAALSAAIGVSYRLQRASEESAARIGELLSDASTPISIRLETWEGLSAIISSPRPVDVKFFLLEFRNGTLLKLPGGTYESGRVRLLESYSCQPVRLIALLSSGLALSTDWQGCAAKSPPALPSRDPLVGDIAVVLTARERYRSVELDARLSVNLLMSRDCSFFPSSRLWVGRGEALLWRLETPVGRVDVWARCVNLFDEEAEARRRVLYLSLEGPLGVSFSGRAAVRAHLEETSWQYSRQLTRELLLPMYSPGGSSRFSVCMSHTPVFTSTVHYSKYAFSGEGSVTFEGSRRIVVLIWSSYAESERYVYWPDIPPRRPVPGLQLDLELELREARVYEPLVELNLTLPAGTKIELLQLRLSGVDAISRALSAGLPPGPQVEATIRGPVSFSRELSSPLYLPFDAQVILRLYRPESPLRGAYTILSTDYPCNAHIEGSTVSSPLPSPWAGPVLVRVGERLLLLGASQELFVTDGSKRYGYAWVIREAANFSKPVRFFELKWDGMEVRASLRQEVPYNWGGRGWALAVSGGEFMIVRVE